MRYIVLALCAAGCSSSSPASPASPVSNRGPADDPLPPDAIAIRACNDTGKDFVRLEWNSPDGVFGPLAAGACTPYRVATRPQYRYTFTRFDLGGEVFQLQPIDFVGEEPLTPGRWSYRITIRDDASREANVAAKAD